MERNLKIIFTSDMHGYFFPTDYLDEKLKNVGLLHNSQRFNKDKNTLIIDGGDTLQGSPFAYYCKIKNTPEKISEIINQCGYDIITLGNHDFNYGFSYLQKYLDNLNAICVCENCVDNNENKLFPHRIITVENGLKIGVVGCVTEFVNLWEKKENIKDIQIKDVFENVKEAYFDLKDKVDLTICIYHGGFECDTDTGEIIEFTGENVGGRICKELGFDILLTGHQHIKMEGKYFNGTYIVQNLPNSMSFHEINIKNYEGKNHISSNIVLSKDLELKNIDFVNSEYNNEIQQWLNSYVGTLDKEILPKSYLDMALNGSELADFINKIQMEYTGAEISCTSFANNVKGFNKEVKIRDVLLTYPFPNTLVVCEFNGNQLKEILERSAEYLEVLDGKIDISEKFLKPKIEHYNHDYFLGIDYEVSYDRPIGERISNMKVKGEPVLENKTYTLCTNSFRAQGSGGYNTYKETKIIKVYSEEIFEVILNYIKNFKN